MLARRPPELNVALAPERYRVPGDNAFAGRAPQPDVDLDIPRREKRRAGALRHPFGPGTVQQPQCHGGRDDHLVATAQGQAPGGGADQDEARLEMREAGRETGPECGNEYHGPAPHYGAVSFRGPVAFGRSAARARPAGGRR
jgi:hypothetical protein